MKLIGHIAYHLFISFFISIVGVIFGGSVLSFSVSGKPSYLLAGPIAVLFGWFYIPVVFMPILLGWMIYQPQSWKMGQKLLFVFIGGLLGLFLFDRIGIKEPGIEWTYGYRIAGYMSGMFCFSLVVLLKRKSIIERIREEINSSL